MAFDLSGLSDKELTATVVLLGERSQEITNAMAIVQREQARRAATPEPVLGPVGEEALADAVAKAPDKASEVVILDAGAVAEP